MSDLQVGFYSSDFQQGSRTPWWEIYPWLDLWGEVPYTGILPVYKSLESEKFLIQSTLPYCTQQDSENELKSYFAFSVPGCTANMFSLTCDGNVINLKLRSKEESKLKSYNESLKDLFVKDAQVSIHKTQRYHSNKLKLSDVEMNNGILYFAVEIVVPVSQQNEIPINQL